MKKYLSSRSRGEPEGAPEPGAAERRRRRDASPPAGEAKKMRTSEPENDSRPDDEATLSDLSDDVLLCILQHCNARDLKAFGFTCERFARLVSDRTLWSRVDTRSHSVSRRQLAWYLANGVHSATQSLCVRGHALEAKGCLGRLKYAKGSPEERAANVSFTNPVPSPLYPAPRASTSRAPSESATSSRSSSVNNPRLSRQLAMPFDQGNYMRRLPRLNSTLFWHDVPASSDNSKSCDDSKRCVGPKWTLSPPIMSWLSVNCPSLTELRLEFCNINCSITRISHFPPLLKILSLRGSRMYNMPASQSYLLRVADYLPYLEELDVCDCKWLDPPTLMPLSKLAKLHTLLAARCTQLSECVAYASLACRYGFRELKVLDLRGTPVGDSEVSGLGWLPKLEELYLEPAVSEDVQSHCHYLDEPNIPRPETDEWEQQEPDYFSHFRLDVDNLTDNTEKINHSGAEQDWRYNFRDSIVQEFELITNTLCNMHANLLNRRPFGRPDGQIPHIYDEREQNDLGMPHNDNGENDAGRPHNDNGRPQNDHGMPHNDNGRGQNDPGMPHNDNGGGQNEPGIPHNDNRGGQNEPGIPHNDNGRGQNAPGMPHNDNGGRQNAPGMPHNDNGGPQNDPGMPHNDNGGGQNDPGMPHNDNGGGQNEPGMPHNDNEEDQDDAQSLRNDEGDDDCAQSGLVIINADGTWRVSNNGDLRVRNEARRQHNYNEGGPNMAGRPQNHNVRDEDRPRGGLLIVDCHQSYPMVHNDDGRVQNDAQRQHNNNERGQNDAPMPQNDNERDENDARRGPIDNGGIRQMPHHEREQNDTRRQHNDNQGGQNYSGRPENNNVEDGDCPRRGLVIIDCDRSYRMPHNGDGRGQNSARRQHNDNKRGQNDTRNPQNNNEGGENNTGMKQNGDGRGQNDDERIENNAQTMSENPVQVTESKIEIRDDINDQEAGPSRPKRTKMSSDAGSVDTKSTPNKQSNCTSADGVKISENNCRHRERPCENSQNGSDKEINTAGPEDAPSTSRNEQISIRKEARQQEINNSEEISPESVNLQRNEPAGNQKNNAANEQQMQENNPENGQGNAERGLIFQRVRFRRSNRENEEIAAQINQAREEQLNQGREEQMNQPNPGRVQVICVNVQRPRNEMLNVMVQDMAHRAQMDQRQENNALRNGPNFVMMPAAQFQELERNDPRQLMSLMRTPFFQNIFCAQTHIAGSSLITDSAINRFGYSEGPEHDNYVHIGPNGAIRLGFPPAHSGERPNKAKLKVLVCRGFVGITNRSLTHLATASPDLRLLDFTGTKVTDRGVQSFKNIRPDCEVKYNQPKV